MTNDSTMNDMDGDEAPPSGNTLTLDLSDPDLAEAVGECKVGDTKTFDVTVTVDEHIPGKSFRATVDSIAYTGTEGETGGESGAGETETEAGPVSYQKPNKAKNNY